MKFSETQTFCSLARSFAGECQAGMRYQLTAKAAQERELFALADVIRTIAKNETNHARVFFEAMLQNGGSRDDVHVDAHYPFHAGTLEDDLRFAAEDERSEAESIYPSFAAIAREEGFADIARRYEQIARVEAHHRVIFRYLWEAVKDGTLYRRETPALWICGECGYMHTSREAWEKCPLCGAPRGKTELHLPYAQE